MKYGDPYRTGASVETPAPKCKRCGHRDHAYFRSCGECTCLRGYDVLFWLIVPIAVFLFILSLLLLHPPDIPWTASTLTTMAKVSLIATLFLYMIDRIHRRQIKRLEAALESRPMEESSGVRVELADHATSPSESTVLAANHSDQGIPVFQQQNEASHETTRMHG